MARHSKFSESEIIAAIREIEAGTTQTEVGRRLGVSKQTLMRWKAKYSGMDVAEAKEKKRLEDENTRLRQLVARFALEIDSLKAALGKKW
jgi:putative transposase